LLDKKYSFDSAKKTQKKNVKNNKSICRHETSFSA